MTAPAVIDLNIDLIAPHPKNPRRDLGDLTELTASIKADGVRNAVHVVPIADGGAYLLVQGHRRHEASRKAGRTSIPAIIRDDLKTDADALVEMAVENLLRADLTPIEEATLFEQLQIAGLKPTAIAKRTGRKKATVEARLALMTLPEPARDAVHAAQLTLEDAAALVEFADDPEVVERLTGAAGTSDFRWQLQNARSRRDDKRRRDDALAQVAAAGVRVVTRDDLDRGTWSHGLDNVLGQIDGITADTTADQDVETRRAAHADCPHHAAFIDAMGRIDYVCVKPDVHAGAASTTSPGSSTSTSRGSGQDTAAADAEREAREAAEQRDQADCDTAAAIRKTFLLDTIAGRRGVLSPASCTAIALHVAEIHLREGYLEGDSTAVADFLEVTLPEEPTGKVTHEQRRAHDDACLAMTRDEGMRRGGHVALLALLAAQHEGSRWGLRDQRHWRPDAASLQPGSIERSWLTLLADLGYELTDWEAARVAAADAHAVDNAGDDEDGE